MKERMALMRPATTSSTWMANAVGGPPGVSRVYTATAGDAFALTGVSQWSSSAFTAISH
jgi:hypothetical protein